jgi:hypothetical protein
MHSHRGQWSQEQINFLSEVIATGVLVKTDRSDDPAVATAREVSRHGEVESTFLVQEAYKGEIPSGEKIVVRHLDGSDAAEHPHEGAKYLLYLKIGMNDRFEPTTGVQEPSVSIRRFAAPSLAA